MTDTPLEGLIYAPAGWWALLAAMDRPAVSLSTRFDKRRKCVHRYTIADTRGPLDLTIPIAKPSSGTPWGEVGISSHGQWWAEHLTAWESAYGRTPYFEFYIDRFKPLLAAPGAEGMPTTIGDMIRATAAVICPILAIPEPVFVDVPASPSPYPTLPRYYQLRQQSLGFIPGLSILDLIFNEGPRSAIIIREAKHLPS